MSELWNATEQMLDELAVGDKYMKMKYHAQPNTK